MLALAGEAEAAGRSWCSRRPGGALPWKGTEWCSKARALVPHLTLKARRCLNAALGAFALARRCWEAAAPGPHYAAGHHLATEDRPRRRALCIHS